MEKNLKKQKKLEEKNKKWFEKYGVKYTDCLSPKQDKQGKKIGSYTKKLMFLFKDFKGRYVSFFLLGIFIALIAIIEPICWQNIIDNLTAGNFTNVIYYTLAVCVFMIVIRALYHLLYCLINLTYHKMNHRFRTTLTDKTLITEVKRFDSTSSGEILNRIDRSTNEFSSCFVSILDLVGELLKNFIFIVYAFVINVYLGAIVFTMGLYRFCVDLYYNKKIRRVYEKRDAIIGDQITSIYSEMIRGIRDVKSLNSRKIVSKKAKKVSLFNYNNNANIVTGWQSYISLRTIGDVFLWFAFMMVAIFLIQNWVVTIGGVLVLILYRNNISVFFDDMGELQQVFQSIEVQGERIWEIMDDVVYKKEKFGTINLENVEGKIELKNVEFKYEDDKPLFNNLSLTINPNECVGFVGKSGQGKSTIMSLLSKFYKPQSGQILLDNIDIEDLTEDTLRNSISVVPQMPYIFNATIAENLRFAKEDATDEEIINACEKAYLGDFIEQLPHKFETKVGEGGVTLSGGQKQRLALARAFLKDSKIILLDEATSALDNESQEKIKDAIKAMQKTKTIVIVAHRLTTVKDCDNIFVLSNSQIIAKGSHKKLMKTCDEYKKLYQDEEE